MNTETIEIKKENVTAAYNAASDEIKDMLEALFGEETFKPKDVRERVKTFGNARNELGSRHPLVEEYEIIISRCGGLSADILAYMKLRIICAALNEGWEPQFTEGERRYYPWFCLYTKQDIDNMDEEEKFRVVYRSYFNAYAYGGVAFAYASNDASLANTRIGSRLAFKTEELAEYAGKQFIELYADLNFKP